jgi:hypothetical protein
MKGFKSAVERYTWKAGERLSEGEGWHHEVGQHGSRFWRFKVSEGAKTRTDSFSITLRRNQFEMFRCVGAHLHICVSQVAEADAMIADALRSLPAQCVLDYRSYI